MGSLDCGCKASVIKTSCKKENSNRVDLSFKEKGTMIESVRYPEKKAIVLQQCDLVLAEWGEEKWVHYHTCIHGRGHLGMWEFLPLAAPRGCETFPSVSKTDSQCDRLGGGGGSAPREVIKLETNKSNAKGRRCFSGRGKEKENEKKIFVIILS